MTGFFPTEYGANPPFCVADLIFKVVFCKYRPPMSKLLDMDRQSITVHAGKGGNDRVTVLPESLKVGRSLL
jgi:hypothetical protein